MPWTTRRIPPAGPLRCSGCGRLSCAPWTSRARCGRSARGRRRYSRRQLAYAAQARELVDQGHTVAAAQRILALEDDLAAERALTVRRRGRLAGPGARDS